MQGDISKEKSKDVPNRKKLSELKKKLGFANTMYNMNATKSKELEIKSKKASKEGSTNSFTSDIKNFLFAVQRGDLPKDAKYTDYLKSLNKIKSNLERAKGVIAKTLMGGITLQKDPAQFAQMVYNYMKISDNPDKAKQFLNKLDNDPNKDDPLLIRHKKKIKR